MPEAPTELAELGRDPSSQLAVLEPLVEVARAYVAASRSPRTRALYAAQWQAFERWCLELGAASRPAAPEVVALYLSARAQAGRKVATLELALAAINKAHVLAGDVAPGSSELVRETLRGIRRTHGRAQAQKAPLLVPELRAMLRALPPTLRGARDRALLLVGFVGGFRRSELVTLQLADLVFTSEGLTITLRSSKTDQEGEGRKLGLPYGSTAATCSVRATQAWVELAGIREGVLFRSVDRHGRIGGALEAREVARIVKRTARAAELEHDNLAGHSLRAGLVTSAAKAGKSLHAIMKTTGHRSAEMVQRYVRDAQLFDDNAAAGLL